MSKNETQQTVVEVKPLSTNAFVAFFQRIWRWWLGVWYGFAEKHPKGSKLIYQIFFFIVFSEGVTIWQFIVMTFLPYAFEFMGTSSWGWPSSTIGSLTDNGAVYIIFGDTNGLGYWVAFEIATFTAQCINFPLQRNITFKSKGNPVWQAMWYFIGWVLISVAVNAIWGLINVFLTHWGWYLDGNEGLATIAGLIKTVLTGGISMVIFFFIFMVIFPDLKKAAANAAKKVEKLKASGADAEKIKEAEHEAIIANEKYVLDDARVNVISTSSTANSKAVIWNSMKEKLEKEKANGGKAEDIATLEAGVQKQYDIAYEAAVKRDEALAKQKAVQEEVAAARAARGETVAA